MRNPGIGFEIDIDAIEHNPFAIRRRHRRADALQLHHVLEREWTLLRCRLREYRDRERENEREQNFHEPQSFRLTPSGASSVLASTRLRRVGWKAWPLLCIRCSGVSPKRAFKVRERETRVRQHARRVCSPKLVL